MAAYLYSRWYAVEIYGDDTVPSFVWIALGTHVKSNQEASSKEGQSIRRFEFFSCRTETLQWSVLQFFSRRWRTLSPILYVLPWRAVNFRWDKARTSKRSIDWLTLIYFLTFLRSKNFNTSRNLAFKTLEKATLRGTIDPSHTHHIN